MDKGAVRAKNRLAMREPDFEGADLARWLQEAGRRRPVHHAEDAPAVAPAPARRRIYVTHPRELLLCSIAALAYMPYFYAGVYAQIYGMKSLIVFV